MISLLFEDNNVEIDVSTGYFNLYDKYAELFLHHDYPLTIFLASPQVLDVSAIDESEI